MVANCHKRHFCSVQVVMEYFERFVSFLWKSSLVHEDNAIDRKRDALVAALTGDGTREHRLDLFGSSVAGTLVKVWVQRLENIRLSEDTDLGLLPLEVCEREVEGQGFRRTRLPHDDEGSVRHGADNVGKQVLLQCLGLGNPIRDANMLNIPIQFLFECLYEVLFCRRHLVVEHLCVLVAVLGVQSEIVDNAKGHQQSSEVVVTTGAKRSIVLVHFVQPLIKGEDTLDVTLADGAARTLCRVPVRKATVLKLLIGVLPHQILTSQDEIGESGLIGTCGFFIGYFHLGCDVLLLLLLPESPVVPHEALEGRVELTDIVGSSDPSLLLEDCG